MRLKIKNLIERGAQLLDRRIGAVGKGVMSAFLGSFFDWVLPHKIKIAYVVYDQLSGVRRTDNNLITIEYSWRIRLLVLIARLGMCIAYLVWVPSGRLIMISCGVTSNGTNFLISSWVVILNDGPRNEVNKARAVCLKTAFGFLVSSYFLTHHVLLWGLEKWAFVGVLSLHCIDDLLYDFRGKLPMARTYYQVRFSILMFISRAWVVFDYVEAQLVERLPRYLQHKWSSYQQSRPERARLPIYQYRPLNAGDVRLLIFKKSPFYPSVLQAKIVHRPISPPPDYEAVSYLWGSSELTEEIIVDGRRFPVTKAALGLLLARRSVWRERTLWIDALCINQEDLQEKSEQVQLMHNIYHQASRVIAYPASDWRFRLAGSLIYQLWPLVYQSRTDKAMNWSPTPDESKSPHWMALKDLFHHGYFNRAWVIQEIAVGQKVELYVGGTYIPWMVFAQVMSWCFQLERQHMFLSTGSLGFIWRNGQNNENVAVMTVLRVETDLRIEANAEFSHIIDLENLLYVTFHFLSTDPRDKVFGLIGIARNAADAALTTPDYSLPVEQVFQNAARAIFSLPRDRRTIHILALAGIGYSECRRKLPSWVPDFCEERRHYTYSNVIKSDGNFKASGDLPQDLELDDETNSLIIKAITIDRVLDLNEFGVLDWGLQERESVHQDLLKTLRVMQGFVRAAIDLCKKHPGSLNAPDKMAYERLWWALIVGRVLTEQNVRVSADVKFKEVFQHWLLHLDHLIGARDWSHYIQLTKDMSGDDIASMADGAEATYQFSIVDACWGRQLAITTSGRLCVVPPLAKVGDSVIIPFGSQTPFLIRERHVQSENIGYELIGEAWVDGVMHGEMIGNPDEEFIRIS